MKQTLGMAVEAHHLHLFPSQLITNRELNLYTIDNQASISGTQMLGFGVPPATGTGSFIPFYNSCSATNTAGDASDSGLTFHDLSSAVLAAGSQTRKRPRVVPDHRPFSFLGEDLSPQIQQQQLEIDRLVTHHAEKVRLELWERRRLLSRRLVAAVEEGMLRRLRAREEEMEKIGKLNLALEERVKSLCLENQIWRELAQTNEAAANVLRTNLEQVLAKQARAREEEDDDEEEEEEELHHLMQAAAGDAESCCDNHQNRGAGEEDTAATLTERLVCRGCGKEEPSVLLLPCRHLCLCPRCSPAAQTCPICRSHKQCTVHVNLS